MVSTHHRLEQVRHGFDNLKVAISMWKTKVRRRGIAGVTGWWPNSNNAIINNYSFESRIDRKTIGMGQETWQSDFVTTRQCPVSHIKTGERHLEIAWMGHPSASAVILCPGGIWPSPLRIMGHELAEQHFRNFEEVGKWLNDWFAVKQKQFFCRGIHNLPGIWPKCEEADGKSF
jgi:hypothetical protein